GAVPGRWGACLAVRPHRPLFLNHRGTEPRRIRKTSLFLSVPLWLALRDPPDRCQKSLPETTSPPARVLRARSVGGGVLSLRKRTEPSAKAKLAPPGWPLPKAQARSSSVEKSPPSGTR